MGAVQSVAARTYSKVESICVGFDDHKQEVLILLQAPKTPFRLYTQGEKEGVDQYTHNFWSLWDMVKAFGRSPGVHKSLVDAILKHPTQVRDVNNVTVQERVEAEEATCKVVKAVLLISGTDKRWYAKLKDKRANNYLLGMDQYPDTFDKSNANPGELPGELH